MRDLRIVIGKMFEFIPDYEIELISKLQSRQDSCLYTAPEAFGLRWQETAKILSDHLGPLPLSGWKLNVYNIWMDKHIDKNMS